MQDRFWYPVGLSLGSMDVTLSFAGTDPGAYQQVGSSHLLENKQKEG